MCRTLRGGRAEAMTTFTPLPGRHFSACTVCALTCLLLLSSVPSRSMATSLIGYSDMEIPSADSSQAFAAGRGIAAGRLIFFCFDDLGDDLRGLPSMAGTSLSIAGRDPSRGFGAFRAMLLS